ncbi:hypothetical protein M3Y96_00179700 [Aphelenchoides besseyi]|nr:hypothetical protein M3Y96_00179700 [Aphelenchoides besseyi]
MVEILDESPALEDPLFLEIWDKINLKKQLEEAYRQLSIAHSMPDTVKRSYLTLIAGFRREMEDWYVEERTEDMYKKTFDELEEISKQVENSIDAMEAMEFQKKFADVFATITKDGDLENRFPDLWDGLERRTRELLRVFGLYLRDGLARISEMNEEIHRCEEHYESLRFGIVRNAETEIATRMTQRFQKMRLDFVKEVSALVQQSHSKCHQKRLDAFLSEVNERRALRQQVDELKGQLSALRVRYYTEPVEMERNLNVYRNQVLENDQKIALLQSELRYLQEEVKNVDPVSSLKPECSARETPIYDVVEENRKR